MRARAVRVHQGLSRERDRLRYQSISISARHMECVLACGEVRAIDFGRRETQRRERFDLVLDLRRRRYSGCMSRARLFAPGAIPLTRRRRRKLGSNREFEKRSSLFTRKDLRAQPPGIAAATQCIDICSTRRSRASRSRQSSSRTCAWGAAVAQAFVVRRHTMRTASRRFGMRIRRCSGFGERRERACLLLHIRPTLATRHQDGRMARAAARVIPFEVFHIASLGIDLLLGSIAYGAAQVVILSAAAKHPNISLRSSAR